ncbi:MAG: hypothetical protein ACYTJ0_09400 [Planctomycetota bacterium]|jgi:hypothetical protein
MQPSLCPGSAVTDPEVLERITEDLEPGAWRARRFSRRVALIVLPLIIAGVGLAVAIEGQPALHDLISTLTNPAILAAIVAGSVIPWLTARRERLKRVERVMLGHAVCPHCGYGLTGLPASPEDGATVCPECACAWQLPDRRAGETPSSCRCPRGQLIALSLLAGLAVLGVLGMFVFMRSI